MTSPIRVFRMTREEYLNFAALCGTPLDVAEAEYDYLMSDAEVRALFEGETNAC